MPGFVTLEADGELETTTLDVEDGKVTAIYVVSNLDKLRHLPRPPPPGSFTWGHLPRKAGFKKGPARTNDRHS